jgi:methyl-accepting chemotaxis protein
MTNPVKRVVVGRGKGYLNAAGPQARFIIFLLTVLIIFTIILRIFQKLAAILELPLFIPISLVTLLVFIGVAGTIYSHTFVGPISRIRRTIETLARGDFSISLRLREADDPMLKDLVAAIGLLIEHGRNTHRSIYDAAQGLFGEITLLQEKIKQGAGAADIHKQLEVIKNRREALDTAIQAYRKS